MQGSAVCNPHYKLHTVQYTPHCAFHTLNIVHYCTLFSTIVHIFPSTLPTLTTGSSTHRWFCLPVFQFCVPVLWFVFLFFDFVFLFFDFVFLFFDFVFLYFNVLVFPLFRCTRFSCALVLLFLLCFNAPVSPTCLLLLFLCFNALLLLASFTAVFLCSCTPVSLELPIVLCSCFFCAYVSSVVTFLLCICSCLSCVLGSRVLLCIGFYCDHVIFLLCVSTLVVLFILCFSAPASLVILCCSALLANRSLSFFFKGNSFQIGPDAPKSFVWPNWFSNNFFKIKYCNVLN